MTVFGDMFGGFGGFSLAAELAGGRVAWAGNHDETAVRVHEHNHPEAEHACEGLRVVDWGLLPAIDVLLASPDCTNHSNAGQPSRARAGHRRRAKAKRSRALALEILHAAEATEPKAIVVENVPQFVKWRLFPTFVHGLEALGYHVQWAPLWAHHHGTPQRRQRVFVVATRRPLSPLVLTWPAPRVEPPIGPCIDWDSGPWRPISKAQPKARARILAGRRLGRRYWVQHVSHHRGLPVTRALSTVTTKDQHAVVDGDMYRPLTVRETARAMGFPESFSLPPGVTAQRAKKGLGNAVAVPVARAVIERVMEAA